MESLALIVSLYFLTVLLSGPIAYGLAVWDKNVLALIAATAAIFTGVAWFTVVFTFVRYVGILSAIIGTLAAIRAVGNLYGRNP